jgi:ABC-type sugar transport system, periplasmic component
MKKLLTVVMCIFLSGQLLAGSAMGLEKNPNIPKKGTLKAGIILDWMGASAFVEAINSIKEVAGPLDVQVITWDCNMSAEACIQGIENFIAADVDMIYLHNWTGYEAIKDVCLKALAAGITIVAFDDVVEGAMYTVKPDMELLGRTLGDLTVQCFNELSKTPDSTIVIIGASGTEYCNIRTQFAIQQIKSKLPKARVVEFDVVSYGGSGNAAGVSIGEALISGYNNVVCVLATDSANTALGVSEAYTAAGIKDGVGVMTMDGSLEELRALAEGGTFYATVNLDLVGVMTDLFVRGIEYIRTGNYIEAEKIMLFPNDIVNQKNLSEFYDAKTDQRVVRK